MDEQNDLPSEDRRGLSIDQQHNALDRRGQFKIDFRQRIDLFVKTILLFSGGAITLSINTFIKKSSPELTCEMTNNLHVGMTLLFGTVLAYLISYFLILSQGFYINKNWKSLVPLSDDKISNQPLVRFFRTLSAFLIISGFIVFIIGFWYLGLVTISSL